MKISVALCTYNGEKYLNEQLQSLLAQTRLPDEVVAYDDASSDGSVALLQAFTAQAPFPVRVHIQLANVGLVRNFESALRACEGDLIALCDQDDVWLPAKLARAEAAFEADPQLALLFSDAQVIDDAGQPTGERLWPGVQFTLSRQTMVREGRAFEACLQKNPVTGATAVLRRAYLPLLLPVPQGGPLIHDGWFATLLAALAPLKAEAEPLIQYRRHAAQQVGFRSPTRNDQLPPDYERQYAQLTALRDRLTTLGPQFDTGSLQTNLPILEREYAHFRARCTLPVARWRRVGAVGRELVAGNYSRYSNGWKSAAKDFLVR